ncbi:hypothetical protein EON67_05705 [archaeon]|nr:MAG: hypothetical protein EON67_05705 [archaeon]
MTVRPQPRVSPVLVTCSPLQLARHMSRPTLPLRRYVHAPAALVVRSYPPRVRRSQAARSGQAS